MKLIPFRIKSSEEPDNYNSIYEFLIKGSEKDPYEVEIEIDDFNDTGLVDTRCTCKHHVFRQVECKHIVAAKKCLEEYGVKIDEKKEE